MDVFGDYAKYYDLLYRDKNYDGEAEFVDGLLRAYAPAARTLLELGCGTGALAVRLAERGYDVHGVDISDSMLSRGRERAAGLDSSIGHRVQFSQGDLRTVRIPRVFDAVISTFHVISYQTTAESLAAAFRTAKEHLRPGGVFLFDFWYGPAVVSSPPDVRVKRLEDQHLAITRIAEPEVDPDQPVVDVHYDVFIRDKRTGQIYEVQEVHRMRWLFEDEIASLLRTHGFDRLHWSEWMTEREPSPETWGVCCVGRV